ncbi:MAG TPA: flagellar biosynthetic protein FliR [Candidatus Babeliales bacterium]|nr:flagellar biosynthetic protein FliR [Candidatus Babeliales bacterium]
MVTALLVFARCAGFVFRAPGFAHPSVPGVLRGGLAAALTIAIVPFVAAAPASDGMAFVLAAVTEFLLGSAIGMTAALVYDGAYAGGRIVDDYVGVKAIAPSLQLVAPSGFGRIWSIAYTGAFFLSGAYRPVIAGFANSFVRIPLGAPLHPNDWSVYASVFAASFALVASQVAAPSIALAFVVQIALGALSRAIPRFGSFTLAFPLAFAAALVATAIALPLAAQHVPAPLLAIPGGRP